MGRFIQTPPQDPKIKRAWRDASLSAFNCGLLVAMGILILTDYSRLGRRLIWSTAICIYILMAYLGWREND